MIGERIKHTKKYRWFWLLLLVGCGLFLIFATYMMYCEYAGQDEVVRNSPAVQMKVTGRKKGQGTLKFPDYVYAEYKGKNYSFDCSRKYYRRTLHSDSITVHYDSDHDIAVLPGLQVPHFAFLFVMILVVAIMVIWGGIKQFKEFS